jgi:hypothetical protein
MILSLNKFQITFKYVLLFSGKIGERYDCKNPGYWWYV